MTVSYKDLQAAILARDFASVITGIPYAAKLGMQVTEAVDGLLFRLPYRDQLVGNVAIGALHGGAVAGFMENAALLYLLLGKDEAPLPKSIDFSIEYLRSARQQDVYARCDMVRLGRRVALVEVTAWQDDEAKPVTTARCHLLLK